VYDASSTGATHPASGPESPLQEPRERQVKAWYGRIILSPYLVVSLAAVAYACLAAYRQPWKNDFGMHAAVVERLRQDLLQPADPMVDAETQSPYFTPYTVVLGLIARLTGWSGITTLSVLTPVCVALVLYGLYRFVRVVTDNRWAPVVALVLLLLLWGENPPAWSGFLDLRGLPQIIPYPSTVALGITLLWWAYLAEALDRPQLRRWLVLGGLFGVIIVVHSFTAVGAALGAAALGLYRLRALRPHLIGLALAATLTVVFAWPYYSVIDVMRATGDLNPIHKSLYIGALRTYGVPLALCVPALVMRIRRNRLDPLAWLFIFAFAVVLTGGITENWALGRVWPIVMVGAQVALAVELVSLTAGLWPTLNTRPGPGTSRWPDLLIGGWVALTVVACAWGFSIQRDSFVDVLRLDKPVTAFSDRAPWITDRVAPGDTVLADGLVTEQRWLSRDLIGHGILFVAPPWPDPTLVDEGARQGAVRELIASETPEPRRRELLDRYHVRWIVDTHNSLRWADAYAVEVVAGPDKQRLLRLN
jgi:hypothetical protein